MTPIEHDEARRILDHQRRTIAELRAVCARRFELLTRVAESAEEASFRDRRRCMLSPQLWDAIEAETDEQEVDG